MMALISKTETYECDFCGTRGDTEPRPHNEACGVLPEDWGRFAGCHACPKCLPKHRAYSVTCDEWWMSRQAFESPLFNELNRKMIEWEEANPEPEPEDFGIKKPEVF